MTEIFWLKTWFAVAMIGAMWTSWEAWIESDYDYLPTRLMKTIFEAFTGFVVAGFAFGFLSLITVGLIWFFTA